jgi:hypothetical protein
MNSNSKSVHSPDTYSQPLADIMGTAIALVTLILPISVISHYSSPPMEQDQQKFLIENSGKFPQLGNTNHRIDRNSLANLI